MTSFEITPEEKQEMRSALTRRRNLLTEETKRLSKLLREQGASFATEADRKNCADRLSAKTSQLAAVEQQLEQLR